MLNPEMQLNPEVQCSRDPFKRMLVGSCGSRYHGDPIVALAIIINLAIIVVAHFFTNWVDNFSMRYMSKIL